MDFSLRENWMDWRTEGGLYFMFDQPLGLPWRMDLGDSGRFFLQRFRQSFYRDGPVPPKKIGSPRCSIAHTDASHGFRAKLTRCINKQTHDRRNWNALISPAKTRNEKHPSQVYMIIWRQMKKLKNIRISNIFKHQMNYGNEWKWNIFNNKNKINIIHKKHLYITRNSGNEKTKPSIQLQLMALFVRLGRLCQKDPQCFDLIKLPKVGKLMKTSTANRENTWIRYTKTFKVFFVFFWPGHPMVCPTVAWD